MKQRSLVLGLVKFALFPGTFFLVALTFFTVFVYMGYLHDAEPEVFHDKVVEFLDLSGGTWNYLAADEEEVIMSTGLDPAIVANELLANTWINSNGGDVDIGIQLAILEGESGGGSNLGTCSGIASAAKFSQQEVASAKKLLAYWKEHNVRDWSEIAREMIRPDYSDYTGHCSAGEIGPNGILPSTGVIICEKGLHYHPDDLVSSCNFFDTRVAPYGKTWWLKAIGYKSVQTNEEKFDSLWGWNHSESYRNQLIERSGIFNAESGGWDFVPTSEKRYVYEGKWWQKIVLEVLKSSGLFEGEVFASETADPGSTPPLVQVPVSAGFMHPHPGSFQCGYAYGTPFDNGIHFGIDLCMGEPWGSAAVYAMHSGEVTFARMLFPSEWLAAHWWISGNVVVIEGTDSDGNKIWTSYGHGSSGTMKVNVGDRVEKGQFLMMSGTTGFSTGIHLHLSMKINGQWVNPALYLEGD